MSSGSASSVDDGSNNDIHLASVAKMASSLSINSNTPSIQTSINQVCIALHINHKPPYILSYRIHYPTFYFSLLCACFFKMIYNMYSSNINIKICVIYIIRWIST